MQIIQTEVAPSTSLSVPPVLRVRFCGEGGERVAVDMAAVEVDDAAAIERAKAILVQTATFDSAYDARSNG